VTSPDAARAEVAPVAALRALRRRKRRLASASFFVAGVGFGTLIYLLRARAVLRAPEKRAAFFALVALTVLAFWLGARAEAEIGPLDERIRALESDER
jgi:hypothetical protein